MYPKQIQLVVRTELEPEVSRFQVWHPYHLATLSPGSVGNKNFIIIMKLHFDCYSRLVGMICENTILAVIEVRLYQYCKQYYAWFRFVFSLGSGWEIFVMRLMTTVQYGSLKVRGQCIKTYCAINYI